MGTMTKLQGRPKTAEAYAAAWEFVCPHCKEHIASPGGSFMWLKEEITETIQCLCGQVARTPGVTRK